MAQKVIVIGAVSQNGVYGEGSEIPWKIPADFKNFKELTTDWTVIMGRGTRESLPPKYQPLPRRDNMVITNTPGYEAKDAKIFTSVEQAIAAARTEKVFCIGGVGIWYHAMYIADEAWVTVVKRSYPIHPGTTHYAPELINPPSKWPSFSFDEMTVNKDVEGDIPGFSIVRWIRKKEQQ